MSQARSRSLAFVLALLLLGPGIAACSPAEPPGWDGSRSPLTSRTLVDPPAAPDAVRVAQLPTPDCEPVLALLDEFRRSLAQRRPPDEVLETMSTCLVRASRLLDLIDLLDMAVAAHPGDRGLKLRLAAAFVELGDGTEALRRVAEVQSQAPDEPEALFLEGLVLSRLPDAELAQLQRARQAWARLLQVAPEHKGMGRFPPELVRRDFERLELELARLARQGGQGTAGSETR